jgi:hypothetical protein
MKKSTSIKIDSKIWKEAKLYCIQNEIELGEFIEKLIKEKLE